VDAVTSGRHRITWKALLCLAALGACATAGAPSGSPDPAHDDALGVIAQTLLDSAASKYRRVAPTYDPARGHPLSTRADGSWRTAPVSAWTSGFFAGTLWYLHEYTLDPVLRAEAERFTMPLAGARDPGTMLVGPLGNAYRATGDERVREPLLEAARRLAASDDSRMDAPAASAMRMELLLWGAAHGGDPAWRTLALRQALADTARWVRAPAWGIYALATLHRETRDVHALDAARRLADLALSRLPEDQVPCREFLAAACNDRAPRDAASAAIMASALLDLSTFVRGDDAERYRVSAEQMLVSLASPAYLAANASAALLLHSVSDRPGGSEADVGTVYADYYFVEALLRYLQVSGQSGVRVLGTR
jgi:hypothetical protein